MQHNLPKHLDKLLPKFDPDDKGLAKNHIDKFILVVHTMNFQHKDVVCRLFPLNFKGKAAVWYFSLTQGSITSWGDFSQAFLNKFGEDKTPAMLTLELDRIKMENKEQIKYFNQRFLTLLNRILVASQPPEDIIIENYSSTLPKSLGMFVKQAGKITLVETFEEAIKVEKNSLTFEPKKNGKTDGPFRKCNEAPLRTNTDKKDAPAFYVEKLKQSIRSLTN